MQIARNVVAYTSNYRQWKQFKSDFLQLFMQMVSIIPTSFKEAYLAISEKLTRLLIHILFCLGQGLVCVTLA
jgi:hypothetical protein